MDILHLALVQMDCTFANLHANLEGVRASLRTAAAQGAKLVVFPEAILTGYGYASKDDAWALAENIPGPATEILGQDCRELGVWLAAGMLERRESDRAMFNVCVLLGPQGQSHVYRKIHLPFLGVDRFTTPGDQPFAVHDVEGVKVGILICYDGGFPEASRALMLLGADLILLPTNWPEGARPVARHVVPARAFENTVYFAAVDRVGVEAGFRFIGQSQIVSPAGERLAHADHDRPEILYADIDPAKSRQKRMVFIPGAYEVDRLRDRRPEMYGDITRPCN